MAGASRGSTPARARTERPLAVRAACMAVFFVAGLAICLVQDPQRRPFAADNQIYYFISERVASGIPPHASLVDHKNALGAMLSGAGIRVGRAVGVDDVMAARAVSILVAAATVALVWTVVEAVSGSLIAAHLGASVMLVFGDYFQQAGQGVRPKVFMAFFMVLALAAFVRGKPARAGVWAAATFLCWQPALLIVACLGLVTLLAPGSWAATVRLGAGAIAAFLVYEAYFLRHGILGEQLYQVYVMSTEEEAAYPIKPFFESVRFIIGMGLWRQDWSRTFTVVFLGSMVASAAAALVLPRRMWTWLRARPELAAVLACAWAALAFTMINHQAYPDMFFLYPYVAIASGLVFGTAIEAIPGPAWTTALRWGLATACAVAILNVAWARRTMFHVRRGGLADQYALARQVDMLRDHHGSIWAIGCPHLLALNRQGNVSRFGLVIDPNVRTYMRRTGTNGVFRPRDERGELPGVILVSRGGERRVIPWLPHYYRAIDNESFRRQGVRIWLRRRGVEWDDAVAARFKPIGWKPPEAS